MLGHLVDTVPLADGGFNAGCGCIARGRKIKQKNPARGPRIRHTFADTLLRAHLRAILHGMQGKVNLRQGLLLSHGANGIVDILGLVDILLVVFHVGRSVLFAVKCERQETGEVKAVAAR